MPSAVPLDDDEELEDELLVDELDELVELDELLELDESIVPEELEELLELDELLLEEAAPDELLLDELLVMPLVELDDEPEELELEDEPVSPSPPHAANTLTTRPIVSPCNAFLNAFWVVFLS